MSAETETKRLRLFFALWPDETARVRVLTLQNALKPGVRARWIPVENLHVTLVFLGDVDAVCVPALREVAASVVAPPCALTLDRLEWWRKSQVLCLTPRQTPEGLLALFDSLAGKFLAAGFALEKRAFRAHLTLARKVAAVEGSLALSGPVELRFEAFSLVESRQSRQGSLYIDSGTWPLDGAERAQSQGIPNNTAMR
jgi:2'-5' RNA ligase